MGKESEIKTIIEKLEEIIPIGDHCNPDTSKFPKWGKGSQNCPYHECGIYCSLQEEMVGNTKQCEINTKERREKNGRQGKGIGNRNSKI